jgi:hypothetical protein
MALSSGPQSGTKVHESFIKASGSLEDWAMRDILQEGHFFQLLKHFRRSVTI